MVRTTESRRRARVCPPSPRHLAGGAETLHRFGDREVVHHLGTAAWRPLDAEPMGEDLQPAKVMVSDGLLTEIDVAGHGPGALVGPRCELAARIRVSPACTRAERVALYVNGIRVREEMIPDGTNAGVK